MSLQFEWDAKKARANLAKHDVSFEEAMTVFADPLARIFDDEEHSRDERREVIIGHSVQQELVVVAFAAKGDGVRGTLTKIKRRFRASDCTPDRAVEILMFLPDDRAILCLSFGVIFKYRGSMS